MQEATELEKGSQGSLNATKVNEAVSDSSSSVKNQETTARERKILRIVDLRLLPLMSLLYAFALIDRTNLGIARVAGLGVDLELTLGNRYSVVSALYFVPYIIFQLPSNLVLRALGPHLWMAICVLGWGGAQVGMAFVETWQQLAGCRILLGLFEAGFFPAMIYIISTWYTRHEVQTRMALFYLLSIIFAGFSAIFAYALTLLASRGGLHAWQWIFLVEGLITIVLGVAAFFLLPHFPDKNRFLKEEDTKIVLARVEKDRGDSLPDPLSFKKVMGHLGDWTVWAYSLMLMCVTMPAYAVGFFVTIILKAMGMSDVEAFLLSAPPYVAAALSCLFFAWLADKTFRRAVWIAVQSVVTLIGAALVGFAQQDGVRYFGLFLTNMGASGAIPGILAYNHNNITGQSKRAVSTAMIVSFGGIGGIFATTAFREQDFPRYKVGIWCTIGCQILLFILLAVTNIHYRRLNNLAKTKGVVLENQPGFMYTL